jgi:signal transduction histidine kinase
MGILRPGSDSSRRLTLLVLGVVLPPAVALVWLGLRLLEHDRASIKQRDGDRREAAADTVTRLVQASLSDVERSLAGGAVPAGVVRVRITSRAIEVEPSRSLLWVPVSAGLAESPSHPFEEAERDEFRRQEDQGRARYAALARSLDPDVRAGALVRLARLARRQGRTDDALNAYRELLSIRTVAITGSPADLVARRMICDTLAGAGRSSDLAGEASTLSRDFIRGVWMLDRAAWELAAADIRQWTTLPAVSPEQIAVASAIDSFHAQWPSLAQAAAAGWRIVDADAPAITVLWRGTPSDVTVAAVGPSTVATWLRSAEARALPQAIRLAATTERGLSLSEGGPESAPGLRPEMIEPRTVRRLPTETNLPWVLSITTAQFSDMEKEFAGRRRLLAGGLAALVLLLAGSSYGLWRVVQREMAVARLQTGFVATVSHEFRTPLTSLRHITELLQETDDIPLERRREFYALLGHSTERLHRLVESVLDFARMEDGRRPWNFTPVDISEWLADVVAQFSREHAERTVSIEPIAATLPSVSVDRDALTHAVWNLLDNAVKYSPDGGAIRITGAAEHDGVAIRVSDDGIGIPAAERKAILGRFVRGAQTEKLGIKGTGLGLAMVSHVVAAHRGSLEIDSEEGRGSTFTIRLPANTSGQGAATAAHTSILNAGNSHR